MIDKIQFTRQLALAKEAREFLEKKLTETEDAEMKERIAQAAVYCQACEDASAVIVELLDAEEKKAADEKKAAEKKTEEPKKKRAPKKKPEEPPADDLEDLF